MTADESSKTQHIKNVIELGLLCMQHPVTAAQLAGLFDNAEKVTKKDVELALAELAKEWETRVLELVRTAGGWQLRTRAAYADYIKRLQEQAPQRLSRQMLEVLAIVAYNQGVTRGDIESIRGVSTSASQLATLEEIGWIEVAGRRDTPGRPLVYATTKDFLADLGLDSLTELPPLEDFNVADPASDAAAE